MRAIILSLQISTPSAVLRFDSVVGRKPATVLLLLVLEVWYGKPTYRKSWAGNLLVLGDLTFKAKLKSAYNSFIIGPRGLGW